MSIHCNRDLFSCDYNELILWLGQRLRTREFLLFRRFSLATFGMNYLVFKFASLVEDNSENQTGNFYKKTNVINNT